MPGAAVDVSTCSVVRDEVVGPRSVGGFISDRPGYTTGRQSIRSIATGVPLKTGIAQNGSSSWSLCKRLTFTPGYFRAVVIPDS